MTGFSSPFQPAPLMEFLPVVDVPDQEAFPRADVPVSEQTFRSPRSHFWLAVGCGLLFLTMAGATVIGFQVDPPCESQAPIAVLLGFILMVWGGFSLLSLWKLFAYFRGHVTVGNNRVVTQGVLFRREMKLFDIAELSWRWPPRDGSIAVAAPSGTRIRIRLGDFALPDRLQLIRLLRRQVPESKQFGWEAFCTHVANPVRLAVEAPYRPLAENEALTTRRHWDRIFIPALALAVIAGGIAHWTLNQPRFLAAPLPLLALWLFLRISTPNAGFRSIKINSEEQQLPRRLLMEAAVVMLIFVLARVFRDFIPAEPSLAAILTATGIWFATVVYRGHQEDVKRRTERERNEAARQHEACTQWQEIESDSESNMDRSTEEA